jgi:hypothetical protein
MFMFGSGILWGTPLTDATGAAIAQPTPLIFGTLQDSEIDIKFELKQLHGQNQFAVAVGRGKGQITGKAKLGDIRAAFLETLVFGVAGSAGIVGAVYDTVGVAAAASVAVTPPASGTWAADLGVINSATGREMKRVASAPATGQYSVSTGTYTFAAADVGVVMYINYRYNATSTTARKMNISNLPMGYAPSARIDFYGPYMGKSAVLTLNNCISDGFKLSSKNDDFTVPEMGFTAFADAGGVIGTMAFSE